MPKKQKEGRQDFLKRNSSTEICSNAIMKKPDESHGLQNVENEMPKGTFLYQYDPLTSI